MDLKSTYNQIAEDFGRPRQKPRPFLSGYFEKTESVSRQIQQRLESLVHYDPFRKEIDRLRGLRRVPATLTLQDDWDFPPGFLGKIHSGKREFFRQSFAQMVTPSKSKWFSNRSPEDQKFVLHDIAELLHTFRLPGTQVFFYWMFNYFLYRGVPTYPRSDVGFIDFVLPHHELLSSGEKRLLEAELTRRVKDDPWALYEIGASLRKAFSQKRPIRFRETQGSTLKWERSGRKPITYAAVAAGTDFLPEMRKSKDYQRRSAAIRQRLSRLKRRQKREFGTG